MNQYSSISAFDAHNTGLLAAIRAEDRIIPEPAFIATDEERQAWREGVNEGRMIRRAFEPKAAGSPVRQSQVVFP